MAETHECPANLCSLQVKARMLMCEPHWRMVPVALLRDIWFVWDKGNPKERYRLPCLRAVKAVNDILQSRGIA